MRIVLETGKSAAEVARDLGIREATLQNWVSKTWAAQELGDGPLRVSAREELIRLRSNARAGQAHCRAGDGA